MRCDRKFPRFDLYQYFGHLLVSKFRRSRNIFTWFFIWCDICIIKIYSRWPKQKLFIVEINFQKKMRLGNSSKKWFYSLSFFLSLSLSLVQLFNWHSKKNALNARYSNVMTQPYNVKRVKKKLFCIFNVMEWLAAIIQIVSRFASVIWRIEWKSTHKGRILTLLNFDVHHKCEPYCSRCISFLCISFSL